MQHQHYTHKYRYKIKLPYPLPRLGDVLTGTVQLAGKTTKEDAWPTLLEMSSGLAKGGKVIDWVLVEDRTAPKRRSKAKC